ncbi:MAG: D-isomer specific 2-hydroxyacid dehydrogenase family protein [Clostridiaceae bacterium]|nr:D-isomer specific 2-hydroxyacid dehydrogenase family protein [Clostridiaceae bacterium]
MKIIAYDVRTDEKKDFEDISKKLNVEIKCINESLTHETIEFAKEYDGITILGHSIVDKFILHKIKEYNIKCLSTRTIGVNNMDTDYAKELGVKLTHSNYAPNGVSEYTLMLMLMSIRHYKQAMFRGNVNDYSLTGLQGKEMKDLTVGIIGTGKIGCQVIENLKGFGSRVLAYDIYENDKVKETAEYVDLDTLYKESDIISLHMPLLDSTYHIINKDSIDKMKKGVVIINCARGELMDIDDVIKGIEDKKIGALGLDVIENEEGIYHHDRRTDIISNKNMAYLRQFPNVTMTQHMAFYTDAAVRSMVYDGVTSLVDILTKGKSNLEV